jgi:hypothetical protein
MLEMTLSPEIWMLTVILQNTNTAPLPLTLFLTVPSLREQSHGSDPHHSAIITGRPYRSVGKQRLPSPTDGRGRSGAKLSEIDIDTDRHGAPTQHHTESAQVPSKPMNASQIQ